MQAGKGDPSGAGDENAVNGTVRTVCEDDLYGQVGYQKIVTYQTVDAATGQSLMKETYFDGLGREIKTRADVPEGEIVVVETKYDGKGLVPEKSLPYLESVGTTRDPVRFGYDKLGRQTSVTRPDDNPSGTVTSTVTYWKDRTVSTDALGRQRTELRDGFGKGGRVFIY